MVAYILFITFLLLAIVVYFLSNQDLVSPSVLFTVPFAVASLNLLFNISRWNVELNFYTYITIICGTLSFLFGCAFIKIVSQQRRRRFSMLEPTSEALTEIRVSSAILLLWIVFQAISFILCLRGIRTVAMRNGYSGTIFEQIGGYKYLGTHTTVNMSLGAIPNTLYSICTNAGYVWFYVLIRNYFANKKINWLLVINLLFTAMFDLSKGGRQSLIQLLTAGVFFYLLCFSSVNQKKSIPFKTVISFTAIAILIICTFQAVGNFLGRSSAIDFNHYIAVYLSAPIRNLDAYLKNPHNQADLFGEMTFIRFINFLGSKLKVDKWIYTLDLPYLYANGKACGNVYTTFYAYYYDFGFVGILAMPFLMGIISQGIYNNCTKRRKKKIEFMVLIYGFLAYQLAFSFFSNKFYEAIISAGAINKLRDWFIVILSLTKIRLRFGRVRLK